MILHSIGPLRSLHLLMAVNKADLLVQEHPEARECRESANAVERAALMGQTLDMEPSRKYLQL